MPLQFEEFKALRAKGLTIDQIKRFEAGFVPPGFEPPKTGYQKFGETLGDFSAGAVKGLIESGRGIAKPLQTGGQKLLAAIDPTENYQQIRARTGLKSLKPETSEGAFVEEQLKSRNLAETSGKVAEFGAELFAGPIKSVLSAKVTQQAMDRAAQSLVNSATGRGSKVAGDVAREFPIKGEAVTSYARKYLDAGKFFATPRQGVKVATNVLKKTGEGFNKIAASDVCSKVVNLGDDVLGTLNDAKRSFRTILGKGDELLGAIDDAIKNGGQMAWRNALKLKQLINNKKLPTTAFKFDAKLSGLNTRLQDAAIKISDVLDSGAKGTEFSKLNATYSLFKQTRDQLIKVIGHKGTSVKTIGDVIDRAIPDFISTPTKLGAAKSLDYIRKITSGAR